MIKGWIPEDGSDLGWSNLEKEWEPRMDTDERGFLNVLSPFKIFPVDGAGNFRDLTSTLGCGFGGLSVCCCRESTLLPYDPREFSEKERSALV
jgi:hypothetical protein